MGKRRSPAVARQIEILGKGRLVHRGELQLLKTF